MTRYLIEGTAAEAKTLLAELIDSAAAPSLSDQDLEYAVSQSKVRDSENRWITDTGYVETYNVYWAASLCADRRAILDVSTPRLKKFTSEGSTFERESPNWTQLAAEYRKLAAAENGLYLDSVQVWEIDRTPEGGWTAWDA